MATATSTVETRPLNVLCLSEHYLPNTGGTVTYTVNTCENLAKLGHNVYLITHSSDHNLLPPDKWVKKNGYHVFNVTKTSLSNHNTRSFRRFFCKNVDKIILEKIEETRADIVHVLYGHYVVKIFNNKLIKLPIFWTVHNIPPREYSVYQKTVLPIVNQLITKLYFSAVKIINYRRIKKARVSKIITPSEYTRKLLLSMNVEEDRIITIFNGVNINLFRPRFSAKDKILRKEIFPLILCVAAVKRHKGIHLLLKSVATIRQLHPNVHLINIGKIRDEKYKQELDIFINKHGMETNCTFITNRINDDVLRNYYNECDIYVQPSLEEGFCLTILEAATCGKPIIGTNTGAVSEILKSIDQNNLCPTNNSDCLTIKIIETIKQLTKYQQDTFKQHEKIAKQFTWLATNSQLISCYRNELRKQN